MNMTLPNLSDAEKATLNRLLAQLEARQPRNQLRAAYYDGKRAIRQVGTVIPPQYYQLGIVLGWSAKAVDTLARRCNLDAFDWPDGDLSSVGADLLSDDNRLFSEVSFALVSSLIHGVAFAVNTTGAPGEPKALIHFKDAVNATGEWNQRTRGLANLLSVTSRNQVGEPSGLVLYLDGVTITADQGPLGWTVTRATHDYGVPAEMLVYKPRIGRPFGSSRISRAVMSLHDEALRTVIRMEAHADVYSFPEFWLLGADNSLFKNPDGSMKADWQVMLGRIKGIPDDPDLDNPRAEVKQFAASSPQPHIDQLKQQAQLFSGETSIPLTSLGVSDMSNPTSADSYVASREDLIAEAEGATDDWSYPLRRTFVRGLAMANGLTSVPDAWRTIVPRWRSPLYLSRAAQADAGLKQVTAIPWLRESAVGLELLGLDSDQVARALADKQRAQAQLALDQLIAMPSDAVPG